MNRREGLMFAGLWMLGTWAVVATIGCFGLMAKNADTEGTLSACEFNKGRVELAYEVLALSIPEDGK